MRATARPSDITSRFTGPPRWSDRSTQGPAVAHARPRSFAASSLPRSGRMRRPPVTHAAQQTCRTKTGGLDSRYQPGAYAIVLVASSQRPDGLARVPASFSASRISSGTRPPPVIRCRSAPGLTPPGPCLSPTRSACGGRVRYCSAMPQSAGGVLRHRDVPRGRSSGRRSSLPSTFHNIPKSLRSTPSPRTYDPIRFKFKALSIVSRDAG
jgi:hypothetical protein